MWKVAGGNNGDDDDGGVGGDGAWGVRGRARKRLWLYDTLSSLPTPGGGVTALVRVLGVGPVYVDVAIPPVELRIQYQSST